jgi:hypothetical protein
MAEPVEYNPKRLILKAFLLRQNDIQWYQKGELSLP